MGVLKELDLSGKRVTPPSTPWNLPSSQETPGAGVTTTEYNLAKIKIRSPESLSLAWGSSSALRNCKYENSAAGWRHLLPFCCSTSVLPDHLPTMARSLLLLAKKGPTTSYDPLEALPHATQLHQVSVRPWRSEVPHVPRLHEIPPPTHNTVCKVVPEVELHKKLAQARQECLQEPLVFGDPSLFANCSAQHAANSVRLARLARPEPQRASLQ